MPARGVRRLIARLLAFALGGLLLLAPMAQPAFAHAQLLRVSPADGAVLTTAPAAMELEFSEPVRLVDGEVRFFPSGSGPLTLAADAHDAVVTIALPAGLAEDVYAVGYRVVSADGHPISGAVSFRVGTGDAPVAPAAGGQASPAATEAMVAALTLLQYLGLLLFAGLLVFHRLVLRPVRVSPDRPLRWSLGSAAIGAALLVPAGAVRVAGGPPSDVLWPPSWIGEVGWPSVAAALVIGGAGVAARWASRRSDALGGLAIPLVIVALAAPLLVGHTRTTPPAWLMLTADLGHLLAASFWVGGVFGLVREVRRVREPVRQPDPAALRALVRTVARFSGFAPVSVVLLAASGLAMGVLIVGSPDALVGSAYGRTLLLKLGIVAAVVAVAAWNRFVLLPRLAGESADRRRPTMLARALRIEAALLIAVVAVTGVLTNLSPGDGPAGRPALVAVPLEAESQGLTVFGILTPGAVGANQVVFTLRYEGEPLLTDQVTVAARLPAQDLGPLQATPVLDPATGEYTAALALPAAGRWQLQISARVDAFTKPTAVIEFPVE